MGGPKARKHYAVEDRLPEDVRREVERLLIDGATYDELTAWVADQGYNVSRSALARYGREFMETVRALRIIEDQARYLVSDAGEGLVIEEAAAKIFAQRVLEGLVSGSLDAKKLPSMMAAFSRLQSSSVAREKFKADMEKRTAAAAEKVEGQLAGLNIPDEKLEYIKGVIYGIAG